MTTKIAFFGNPGAGKSTLLNCLMVMRHGKVQSLFRSGVNIAKGLTYKFDQKIIGEFVYMDTPGLDDVEMRKQAAIGISKALKQGGLYLIVFVVRESAGKIHPNDLATIKTVLQSAPEIKTYGVIINKLSKPVYDKFTIPGNRSFLQNLFEDIDKSKTVTMTYLKSIPDLEDVDNETAHIPSLMQFVDRLPKNEIHCSNVNNVDRHFREMESEIERLRQQQEKKRLEFEQRKKEDELRRQAENRRREKEKRRLEYELQRQREEQERRQQEARRRQQEQERREAERRRAELERQQREQREREEALRREHEQKMKREQEKQARKQREHDELVARQHRHRNNEIIFCTIS